ncbi:SAVMC3_10250 family protein [Nonomuraea sp. NPDC005650]|uniref:DUF7019 family protein n=1 Tax=Nonomuraea sp. NPDC005650 TaxID=3157045 RepID=UPI0033A92CEC
MCAPKQSKIGHHAGCTGDPHPEEDAVFRRGTQPLRYYVYVSDNKLDMLYEQIDPALRKRISAEVKVDLKVASVTLQQAEQATAARMTKLRMVERYIDTHCKVGGVSAPGREFFRGRMEMRWGWLERDAATDRPSPVVLFCGLTDDDFVVLGGSRGHVLGQHPEDSSVALLGYSLFPGLVEMLGPYVSQLQPKIDDDVRNGSPQWRQERGDRYIWQALKAAEQATLNGHLQHLDFLAVPLGEARAVGVDGTPMHAVIGTPVYVAHAR